MNDDEKHREPEYMPVGPARIAPTQKAKIKIKPTPSAPPDEKPREIDGIIYEKKELPKP